MRNIGNQLALLAVLLVSGTVHALGLGEIDVKSRLNQTLSAVVPVSASSVDELQSLSVALASNEEFARAGLERVDFLSKLQFTLRGDLIEITSREPAREPFISFLLEVRTSSGRLLREYTVLLDPPGFSPPKTEPAPAPVAEKAPEPEFVASPEEPATAPVVEAPAPQPVAKPATTTVAKPAVAAAPKPISTPARSYGPVEGKETLWSIAYKLRPDSTVTMSQMQVAIYDANRSAFDGNLFGLRKGSVLKIPSRDDIAAINPISAKQRIDGARATPKMPPPVDKKPDPVVAEKPVVVEAAPPAPAPTSAVEPVAPTPAVTEAPKTEPAPVAEAATDPAVVAPTAEAEPAPAPEAMYDEDTTAASDVITVPPTDAVAPADPAVATEPLPATEIAPAEPAFASSGLLESPLLLPAGAIVLLLILVLAAIKSWKQRAGRSQAVRVSTPAVISPVDFVDTIIPVSVQPKAPPQVMRDDTTSASLPLQATIGMASQTVESTMAATRSQSVTLAQPSANLLTQTIAQEVPAARSAAIPAKLDFDLTGQFASETMQINLDSNDPIAEADFHLAYGLYDEASLLLQQAAQKDPQRIEIRAKLAEVYFAAAQADNFRKVAEGLKGQLPEAQWQKLAIMGQQMCPDAAIFKGVSAAAMASEVDLAFDEPMDAPAPAPAPKNSRPAEPAPLEFNLDELQLPEPAAEPTAPASADNTLQFDLSDFKLDVPASVSSKPSEDIKLEDIKLDQFDLGESKTTAAAASVESGMDLSAALDTPIEEMPTGDESATKLDLARAYLDMGDSDMAKGLLEEVVGQGNAQQKTEAKELLSKLAA